MPNIISRGQVGEDRASKSVAGTSISPAAAIDVNMEGEAIAALTRSIIGGREVHTKWFYS